MLRAASEAGTVDDTLRCAVPAAQPMTTAGDEMHALVERLYPICRSITGDGVRANFRPDRRAHRARGHEVPTGTQVFIRTVPQEWNIRDAYIADEQGRRRVVDFPRLACTLWVIASR